MKSVGDGHPIQPKKRNPPEEVARSDREGSLIERIESLTVETCMANVQTHFK
jgi:hypothetical protein